MFYSQAVFLSLVRHGMKLEWAILCWAGASLFHDIRSPVPASVSSAEISVLREDLVATRAALAGIEEGHLTCGWRLKLSNWLLQLSLLFHLAFVVWWLCFKSKRVPIPPVNLPIGDTGSTDSEEADSSPTAKGSGLSRSSTGGPLAPHSVKGRPVRPSDLRARHGRSHPQHQ